MQRDAAIAGQKSEHRGKTAHLIKTLAGAPLVPAETTHRKRGKQVQLTRLAEVVLGLVKQRPGATALEICREIRELEVVTERRVLGEMMLLLQSLKVRRANDGNVWRYYLNETETA